VTVVNLAAVMDEIGDRLATIDGLRVYRYPPDDATAPAAIVSYPDRGEFDAAYGRGMDKLTIPIVVVVAKPSARSARDRIAAYCDGSGPASIKQVLEAGTYTTFNTIRVTEFEIHVVTVGTTDYLAAVFSAEISGKGSASA